MRITKDSDPKIISDALIKLSNDPPEVRTIFCFECKKPRRAQCSILGIRFDNEGELAVVQAITEPRDLQCPLCGHYHGIFVSKIDVEILEGKQ